MGRITKGSKRTRIQDYMKKMWDQFQTAQKDDDLQEAFNELWPTWSSEMAAMIYAEILSVMDLLLLTARAPLQTGHIFFNIIFSIIENDSSSLYVGVFPHLLCTVSTIFKLKTHFSFPP